MNIQRAFRVRIYPTDAQRVFLNKTLGCYHFLYNHILHERIETYEPLKDKWETLSTHKYKTEKDYKQEYGFLKEADAFALEQARRNLESAYSNFYKSLKGLRKGEKVGFPRYKAKHKHIDSNRTGMFVRVDFEGQTVVSIPVRCGELRSVDMGVLTFGNTESETVAGIPITRRSRNLGEQAEQSAQATSPCL